MATPKGHKVVTVPRGDGYAARCEVERDGTVHLCDITFGGFESRTDARSAIRHDEQVGAMAEAPNHPNGSANDA